MDLMLNMSWSSKAVQQDNSPTAAIHLSLIDNHASHVDINNTVVVVKKTNEAVYAPKVGYDWASNKSMKEGENIQ